MSHTYYEPEYCGGPMVKKVLELEPKVRWKLIGYATAGAVIGTVVYGLILELVVRAH